MIKIHIVKPAPSRQRHRKSLCTGPDKGHCCGCGSSLQSMNSNIHQIIIQNGREKTRACNVTFNDNSMQIALPDQKKTYDVKYDIINGSETFCDKNGRKHLSIITYPIVKKRNKLQRERHVYTFQCDNEQQSNQLQQSIDEKIDNKNGTKSTILAYINPHSGPGRAMEIFETRVQPVLNEANIASEVYVTKHSGDAENHVKNLDLSRYSCLVVVSGDGLYHEVINGIMKRADRDEALRMPLGIVPGGSGNALATAILHACNEPYDLHDFAMNAALCIARPLHMQLHLVHVQQAKRHLASFVSFTWGIISDIDIGSEKYRKSLGAARFVLFGYIKTMNLKKYRGKLSYLPVKNPPPMPAEYFTHKGVPTEEQKTGIKREKEAQTSEGLSTSGAKKQKSNRIDCTKTKNIKCDILPGVANQHNTLDGEDTQSSVEYKREEDSWRVHYPIANIPRLDEPIPDDWVTIEDDFLLVQGAWLSHIMADAPFLPWAKIDDDIMYLVIIPAKVAGRYQVSRFLLSLDSGGHLGVPAAQLIPVHAFRLEPITRGGLLVADGELIDDAPVQCVMTDYRANVCGRTPKP